MGDKLSNSQIFKKPTQDWWNAHSCRKSARIWHADNKALHSFSGVDNDGKIQTNLRAQNE